MKMLGWILLLEIRDAGVCSVRGSFASRVQHEGESGPEGLSSLLCVLLVQRKHGHTCCLQSCCYTVSLFFRHGSLLLHLAFQVWTRCVPSPTHCSYASSVFFPLLLFECSILSASSSSPISFCQLVLVSWWCFLLWFLFNSRDFFFLPSISLLVSTL